jgi:hypothetical protein
VSPNEDFPLTAADFRTIRNSRSKSRAREATHPASLPPPPPLPIGPPSHYIVADAVSVLLLLPRHTKITLPISESSHTPFTGRQAFLLFSEESFSRPPCTGLGGVPLRTLVSQDRVRPWSQHVLKAAEDQHLPRLQRYFSSSARCSRALC